MTSGDKVKKMSKWILIISCGIGIILIAIGLIHFIDWEYYSRFYPEKLIMYISYVIIGITSTLTGVISYYFLSAFGDLVNDTREIRDHLKSEEAER